MRKLERVEDEMRGQVTYEVSPTQWVTVDVRMVQEYGLEEVMRHYGVEIPTERLPVFQDGRRIGTVPALFEPIAIKSRSFLYDVRPGDFKRTADGWAAGRSLGPGDLDAVPDFIRDGEADHHGQERMVAEAFEVLGALTGALPRE